MSTLRTPNEAFDAMIKEIGEVTTDPTHPYTDLLRRYDALDEVDKAKAFMYMMFRCERLEASILSIEQALILLTKRGDLHMQLINRLVGAK